MESFLCVKNKVFIHSPRKERGMVWRDTSAMRGWSFELLLGYNWIKKGGCCCVAPGLLGRCNAQLQFVPMLSSAWDCREQFLVFLLSSNFQTWKDCREPCDKARYQAISPRGF